MWHERGSQSHLQAFCTRTFGQVWSFQIGRWGQHIESVVARLSLFVLSLFLLKSAQIHVLMHVDPGYLKYQSPLSNLCEFTCRNDWPTALDVLLALSWPYTAHICSKHTTYETVHFALLYTDLYWLRGGEVVSHHC